MRIGHLLRAALPLLGFVLAAPTLAAAAGPEARAIDAIVERAMKEQGIPGVAIAVVRDGRPPVFHAYGIANLEHGVPVTADTIFQSASTGKQFTATALLLLAEEGKLSLDDPLNKFLPPAPAWDGITLRHVLTHTSGIPDPEEKRPFNYRLDYTDDEIVRLLQALPLDFRPGSAFKYSNGGYQLAGIVVTRIAGEFYGDFLVRRVFRPSGMRTAAVISDRRIVPHRAAGYDPVDGGLANAEFVSPALNATADGSLHLSARDWAAWLAAIDRRAVLSPASYEQLWTPFRTTDDRLLDYALGWYVRDANGHRVYDHRGTWQGFRTYIAYYPGQRLGIAVLTNLVNAKPHELGAAIAPLYAPELARAR